MKNTPQLTLLFIVVIVVSVFYFFQVNTKKISKTTPTPSPVPSITLTPTENENPIILDNLQNGSEIKSPLIVTGKVDSSWMFEGVFRVKLLDIDKKLITQTQAKETTPGSWMQPGKIPFSTEINFSSKTQPAYLVFEADNPSGLPENDKSFTLSVK